MKFREITLESGTRIFLGKDAEQNEELVKEYLGKENIIIHTAKPGSPFCVIDKSKPLKKEIKGSAVHCAKHSQDWRDNRNDVEVHVFTGKDVYKRKGMKIGTFGVRNFKALKVKKEDLL